MLIIYGTRPSTFSRYALLQTIFAIILFVVSFFSCSSSTGPDHLPSADMPSCKQYSQLFFSWFLFSHAHHLRDQTIYLQQICPLANNIRNYSFRGFFFLMLIIYGTRPSTFSRYALLQTIFAIILFVV